MNNKAEHDIDLFSIYTPGTNMLYGSKEQAH